MRGSHSSRPKILLAAVAAVVVALALSACNPSGLKVEHNMAKSFARKVDQATDLKSSCTIVASDTKKGSYLSECLVQGAGGYRLPVRVSTDYQNGTFSVWDPYPRSAGGYLEQVDGAWTYRWAA